MGKFTDWLSGKNKQKGISIASAQSQYNIIKLVETSDIEDTLLSIAKYNPWVAACIRLRCSNAKRWDFKIWDGNNDVENHPFLDLLKRPNMYQNYETFLSYLVYSFDTDGNGFSQAIKVGNGLSALLPLPPVNVTVEVMNDRAGLEYKYNGKTIPSEEMCQWKDDTFTNSYERGVGKLTNLLYSVTQANYADRFNLSNIRNGGVPSGILETEGTPSAKEQETLKEKWKQEHGDPDKVGGLAIIPKMVAKFVPLGASLKDMNYEALKNITMDEVCAVYNTPKALISKTESVNYSNAKEQRRIYWETSLIPLGNAFAGYLNEILHRFYPNSEKLEVYLDTSNIEELRDDLQKLVSIAAGLINVIGIKREAVLEKLNLGFDPEDLEDIQEPEPQPQEDNKSITQIKELRGLIKSANTAEPSPIVTAEVSKNNFVMLKGAQREAARAFISDVKTKTHSKFRNDIEKYFVGMRNELYDFLTATLGEPSKAVDPQGYMTALNKLLNALDIKSDGAMKKLAYANFANISKEVVKATLELLKMEYKIKQGELIYFAAHANKMKGINNTVFKEIQAKSADAISSGLSAPELAARLKKEYKEIFKDAESRASTIANTEMNSLANELTHENYRANGVAREEWLTSRDLLVRGNPDGVYANSEANHFVLDGEIKDLDGTFTNGLRYPSDNASGDAGEVINCRCTIMPVIE